MKLEDMSKEELIKIVHQQFKQPTERELLFLRWESLAGASKIGKWCTTRMASKPITDLIIWNSQ